jgi:hypothetical protein
MDLIMVIRGLCCCQKIGRLPAKQMDGAYCFNFAVLDDLITPQFARGILKAL